MPFSPPPLPMLHVRVPNMIEKQESLTFTSPYYKMPAGDDEKPMVYAQGGRVYLSGIIIRNHTGTTTNSWLSLGMMLPEWARPERNIKIGGYFAAAPGVLSIKPSGEVDFYMYGAMLNQQSIGFDVISWPQAT